MKLLTPKIEEHISTEELSNIQGRYDGEIKICTTYYADGSGPNFNLTYMWDSLNNDVDDGVSIIQPTFIVGAGRWLADIRVANVCIFGAKGDYKWAGDTGTDDTLAIQAAIDYVNSVTIGQNGYRDTRGVVYIPAGNYYITGTLQSDYSVSIRGDGQGVSNIWSPDPSAPTVIDIGQDDPELQCYDYKLSDFSILSRTTPAANSCAIRIRKSVGLVIQNVNTRGFDYGLYLGDLNGLAQDVSIIGCSFLLAEVENLHIGWGNQISIVGSQFNKGAGIGCSIVKGGAISFEGCLFQDKTIAGLKLTPITDGGIFAVSINGSWFEAAGTEIGGVSVEIGNGANSVHGFTITNCTLAVVAENDSRNGTFIKINNGTNVTIGPNSYGNAGTVHANETILDLDIFTGILREDSIIDLSKISTTSNTSIVRVGNSLSGISSDAVKIEHGTTPQALEIFNDSTINVIEKLRIDFDAGNAVIGGYAGGSGTIPTVSLAYGSTKMLTVFNGSTQSAQSVYPTTSQANLIDIGSVARPWRHVYANDLFLTALPIVDPVVAGAVWNDLGTLKISSG